MNFSFVLNIFLCFTIPFTKPPSSKYTQVREQHSPFQRQDLYPEQTHHYISLLHISLKAPSHPEHQQALGEAVVSRTSSSWKKACISFGYSKSLNNFHAIPGHGIAHQSDLLSDTFSASNFSWLLSFCLPTSPHHTTFIQSRNSAAEYSSKLSRKPTTTEALGANK